jgi:hypothetical protein
MSTKAFVLGLRYWLSIHRLIASDSATWGKDQAEAHGNFGIRVFGNASDVYDYIRRF